MFPAARVLDEHVCPLHGGGPAEAPGTPDVLINGVPHVTATHVCSCKAEPPDFIVTGASTVLIGNQPAGRLTEKTMHGPGVLLGASPDVLIGSASIGVTLGGGDSALGGCTSAASGRSSGQTRQTWGNCGIESARQIINQATGASLTEVELADDAVAHAETAERTPRNNEFGGTNPPERQTMLARHGVPSSQVPATPGNVMQGVAERRGVITSHDAGALWNDPSNNGNGHAVLVTGVTFDANGQPETVTFNDTGNGTCGSNVPADRFFGSLRKGRNANVTDRPLW